MKIVNQIIAEREREQIQTRIAELEAITNRTAEQEQELQNLKEKLVKLEQQERSSKSYWPWIIGGGIILVLLVGVIIYFLTRNKKKIK